MLFLSYTSFILFNKGSEDRSLLSTNASMDIQVDKQKQYAIVTVKDEKLTARVAPQLKSQLVNLHKEGSKNLILVLSNVQHIDSSGLSAILVAHRLCEENEGLLVLTGVQEAVKKLIDISQLDGVLRTVSTLQDATDLIMIEENKDTPNDDNQE